MQVSTTAITFTSATDFEDEPMPYNRLLTELVARAEVFGTMFKEARCQLTVFNESRGKLTAENRMKSQGPKVKLCYGLSARTAVRLSGYLFCFMHGSSVLKGKDINANERFPQRW